MIRKQLLPMLVVTLTWMSGMPVADSQEIRLEPPQLDRQGIVQRSRPDLVGRARRAVLSRSSRASRMGVSRVARQEPIRMSPQRGIFRMAAVQQDGTQGNAAQGNGAQDNGAAQGNPNTLPQDNTIIQDDIILDDGVILDDGTFGGGVPIAPYPQFQIISFADMEYFAGVEGFKGVPNLGETGSFGFNQGINWGFPLPILPVLGLSGQLGVRFTQSEMSSSPLTNQGRDQVFLTGGISRRVDYGLQFGVSYDLMNDRWYYDALFSQLRTEVALVGGFGNQFGFRYTAALRGDSMNVAAGLRQIGGSPLVSDFIAQDTYRFFYRQQWDQIRGGFVEGIAGFSRNGDGIIGADILIPIAERWALTTDFTAMFPKTAAPLDSIDESWNVGVGLTWYPKGLSTWSRLYHRPLMDVADNGTFLFRRQ